MTRAAPICALILVLAWPLASQGGAAPSSAGPRFDTPAAWLKKPTQAQLWAAFPPNALKSAQAGSAVLECQVTAEGAVVDCTVVSETPAGLGFGVAAVGLTSEFQMRPAMKDGRPVGSTVRFPINFEAAPPKATSIVTTLLSKVVWAQAPTLQEVLAAYPADAQARQLGGRATLDCKFAGAGKLMSCLVIEETPRRSGFGRAAQKLSAAFVGPSQFEGRSTRNMRVQFPIVFAPQAGEPPPVSDPRWLRTPSLAEFAQASTPAPAGVEIAVGLDCEVIAGGRLQGCRTTAESPAGRGYGEAALKLSPQMQVALWTDEGRPTVGSRVRATLKYGPSLPQ